MSDAALREEFRRPALSPALRWQNEPTHWHVDTPRGCLVVEADADTDFWQRTHYGFERDNGHFLHLQASGDFVLTTRVRFSPWHQYDQAGLMVRVSPTCWLKTSVEFEPEGPNRLGAVVTNGGYSDWSTQALDQAVDQLWFRIRAEDSDCIVECASDGLTWTQIRMAHLHERLSVRSVQCGLYACSPKAAGYRAEFDFLDFSPGRVAASATASLPT